MKSLCSPISGPVLAGRFLVRMMSFGRFLSNHVSPILQQPLSHNMLPLSFSPRCPFLSSYSFKITFSMIMLNCYYDRRSKKEIQLFKQISIMSIGCHPAHLPVRITITLWKRTRTACITSQTPAFSPWCLGDFTSCGRDW